MGVCKYNLNDRRSQNILQKHPLPIGISLEGNFIKFYMVSTAGSTSSAEWHDLKSVVVTISHHIIILKTETA